VDLLSGVWAELGLPVPGLGAIIGCILAGALAGLIRGLTGFGAALVMVPVLSLFLSPVDAVVANLVALILTNIPLLVQSRQDIDRSLVKVLFLGNLAGLPLGVWLLSSLPAEHLQDGIGACVIGAALLLANPRFRLSHAGPVLRSGTGGLSGLLNGAVGMGGPPVILLLLALHVPPPTARASLVLFFTLQNTVSLGLMAATGLLNRQSLLYAALLVPPLLLTTQVGHALFNRGWSSRFRSLAIGILLLTGAAALFA
jgi:uncharacterized protein